MYGYHALDIAIVSTCYINHDLIITGTGREYNRGGKVRELGNSQKEYLRNYHVDVELDGHHDHQSFSKFVLSTCPFKSIVGPLEVLKF